MMEGGGRNCKNSREPTNYSIPITISFISILSTHRETEADPGNAYSVKRERKVNKERSNSRYAYRQ